MAILDTIKSPWNGEGGSEQTAIAKSCPNCGTRLEFTDADKYVTCEGCEISFTVAELLNAPSAAMATAAPAALDLSSIVIESAESGLIYLESFFENYDWDAYKNSSTILIKDLNTMVEKNKIRQGAVAAAWRLDYESVATPLSKKLEGLAGLEAKMAEEHNGKDSTGVLAYFDRYKGIAVALIDNRDKLIKRMENDLAYAKKLGLDAALWEAKSAELTALTKALKAVKNPEAPLDLAQVADKQKKIDREMVRIFKEKGIDVAAEYKNACSYYAQNTNDKRAALKIFESIRGYGDSLAYIEKINKYFNYYGKFFNFFGTNFVYKVREGASLPLINPTAKSDKKSKSEPPSEEETYTGQTLALHEVVDGEAAEKPLIENISQIIAYYGSKLFYLKLGKTICSFDLGSKINTELYTAKKPSDLKIFADTKANTVYYSTDKTAIFFRSRLDLVVDNPGCFAKLLGKGQTIHSRRNNYAVYKLDLLNDTCEIVIDQIVDIIDRRGDYLFYTVAEELAKGEVETEETEKDLRKLSVMAMHTATGKQETVFKENCDIKAIWENKIVYTLYAPNRYNLDLHVFDIDTKSDVLIEKNVYSFLTVTEGRIFYYVGNSTYRPLFSNNLEGTDRVEIMTNIERIVKVEAGWIYVMKGSSRNALLVKISTDGKQRLVICSQFQKSVKVTDSYIYYVDTRNSLRVVRSDGQDNLLIAENIDLNNVIVDHNCIYYLRRERVGAKMGASLYRMDIDGHNIRKLLFNVISMKNYDDNTLYVERADQIRFNIFFPAPSKKAEREEVKTFDLTRYYKYDKTSGELDNVLTVGMPHPKKYEATGCFGKKSELEPIFTEIPIEDDFEEKGERAGTAMSEQVAEKEEEDAAAAAKAASNPLKGCNLLSRFKK